MNPRDLTERVKAEALRLGFDLVGIARADAVTEAPLLAEWLDRGYHATMTWMTRHFAERVDPRALVPGCRSVVCAGLVYHQSPDRAPEPEGVEVATYAWGEDYHRVLKDKLRALLEYGRALDPAFDGRAFVDSAPVMERYWAEMAGLGWRGWLFGCDICQDVCPWNRDAPETAEPRLTPRPDAWPGSVDELLELGAEEFDRRFAETAVERTRRRGLVRNAAIVAGNTGRGSAGALDRASRDDDPVVAGAARRALDRRGPAVPATLRGGSPRGAGAC